MSHAPFSFVDETVNGVFIYEIVISQHSWASASVRGVLGSIVVRIGTSRFFFIKLSSLSSQ